MNRARPDIKYPARRDLIPNCAGSPSGDFFDQPRVADGASDLFREIFGSDKLAVRSVIGVASLTLGMPIELEVIFEQAQKKEITMNQAIFYRTVKVDGLSIFYREAGPKDASVILLLHGLPSSSRMFQPLLTRLAGSYHLIAPDYPGFGHSDWPDPTHWAYTFDHIASVMDGFTEALGLSHYTLYMQDYGAPVGFRMILAHPERVQALIVQDGVSHNEGLGQTGLRVARFGQTAPPMKKRCARICCRSRPRRRGMSETTHTLSFTTRICGPMSTPF